jgi:CubicO group peptidase (beta-lactamase class C family)
VAASKILYPSLRFLRETEFSYLQLPKFQNMKKSLFFLLLVLSFRFGAAQTLILAKPEAVGMSVERLARIDNVVNEYIAKKWFPGAVVLIARNGKIVYHKSFGVNDTDKQTALKKDDIFRIASQTKAITSTAIMILYEEGKLGLDDPLSRYIPEFKNPKVLVTFNEKDTSYTTEPAKSEITIRQLLTHTSGIDYPAIGSKELKAIYAKAKVPSGIGTPYDRLGEKIKVLGSLPLRHQPGDRFTYGLNTDVLGYVVEVVSGMNLDEFFKKRIFEPLGMEDTYFYLPREKQGRLTTLYEEKDGLVKKVIATKDRNPDYPDLAGSYYSGGAGLSSTVADYARFLQMYLNGGLFNGKRILGRKTIELMMTNQLKDNSGTSQFGLGFGLETSKNDHLSPFSIGSFSWGGIFSTTYWADPKEKIVALIFKQIYPTTHGDLDEKFKELVYQAIE